MGVEGGDGVPLGDPDFEGVTVGVTVPAPATLGERDGDTVRDGDAVGEGVTPPAVRDLEGDVEVVPLGVRERLGL